VKKVKNLEKIFSKGKDFIFNIKPQERILLVFHQDVDGICSAAIAFFALQRLGLKPAAISVDVENWKKILKIKKNFEKLIFLDLQIPEVEKNKKKILIIDHHIPRIKTKNLINPRILNKKVYQPASYVAYKFFSNFVDIRDKEWIAVLGTIADYGFEDCRDLLNKWIKVKKKENVWRTKFGKAAILLYNAAIEIGFENAFKILLKSKNLKSLSKNKKIKKANKRFEKYYKQKMKEFWKNVEKIEKANLIFCVMKKLKKRVGSIIVTKLSRKYPDKTILLLTKKGKFYKIHARGGKVNLGKLLEKMGVGGGHEKAAGGIIKKNELQIFKKRLFKELRYKNK